ncbi:MAG: radical SAM protein [Polyangiaceae bacterium]|nr:radical SAM protein [Polyangiaceae bacterium]
MEPKRQAELQLGHMCNNRCVFCVSGQETALGRARPLPVEPLLERVREARARGNSKLTLLGGEPTLQPGFPQVLAEAVRLGFEEIVVFTNGVKTGRASLVDELIELGAGRVTWRLSFQGGTEEAHERTTRRPGSFGRLLRTLEHLHARGQRVTANLCVVSSNCESVAELPALLLPFGVSQIHLDMMRPLDAGARTEEELAAMLPRYSRLVTPFTRLAAQVPAGFDLNLGNLPYCIAPALAPLIHHDGEATDTIAIDGDAALSRPWNKYEVKRRDKVKPEGCRECVFEARCSGVFETYRALHGVDELVPVTAARLRELDPQRRVFWAHLTPLVRALGAAAPPAPFERVAAEVTSDVAARVRLEGGGASLWLALTPPGAGSAGTSEVALTVEGASGPRPALERGLALVWGILLRHGGTPAHPPGADAFAGGFSPSVTRRLALLRARAPFGALTWVAVDRVDDGARAELRLESPEGAEVVLYLADEGGKRTGGYRVTRGEATPRVIDGLRAAMGALGGGARLGATSAHADPRG